MAYNKAGEQKAYWRSYYARNKEALNAARYARTMAELAENPERMRAIWRAQSKLKRSRQALREMAEIRAQAVGMMD